MFAMKAVALLLVLAISADASLRNEKTVIDNILGNLNNDPKIRPNNTLELKVDLFVINFGRIDDEKMLYNMDIYFRQEWVDNRLKFTKLPEMEDYIMLEDEGLIWTPDLFFNDYKAYAHDVTKPNSFLRVYHDGTVRSSHRYNLLLYCHMDLAKFPFDTQLCRMKIESYAWKAKQVMLMWKGNNSVQVADDIHVPFFSLETYWAETEIVYVKDDMYRVLELSLLFKRELNYYILNVFMPCAMLVICAYTVFWIDVRHFTARIILATSSVYTLASALTNINLDLPKVHYMKAVDIYTGISMSFAFAVLIESIFVYFVANKQEDNVTEKKTNNVNGITEAITDDDTKMRKMKKWMVKNNDLDSIFRVFYPIFYLIFQIVYWSLCLSL